MSDIEFLYTSRIEWYYSGYSYTEYRSFAVYESREYVVFPLPRSIYDSFSLTLVDHEFDTSKDGVEEREVPCVSKNIS